MAAPVDSARVATNIATAATSHAVNVGSPVAGTLLIVAARFAVAPGTITFTGYTPLVAGDTSDASDDTTSIFYRWADGTEGATDTLTTGNSTKCCFIAWEITGAHNPAVLPPQVSTVAVGTTAANSANPTSVVPTGGSKDYLFLAIACQDGEVGAYTASPTNYSAITAANSGTGGLPATNVQMGAGSRQLTAASDDPGAFTHAAAAAGWSAYTVAIHPGPTVWPGAAVFPITFERVTAAPGETSQVKLSLASGSTPATQTNHAVAVRARVTSGTGTLKAALYEGSTNRSGDLSQALTTTFVNYFMPIADASAANITDYSNLELRLWGTTTGASVVFEVAQASLLIPPAEAVATGEVILPITFERVTAARVTAKSAVVLPETFGRVVTAKVTAKSRVDQPITFGRVVQAKVTAKSAVALPITFERVTNSTRISRGAVVLPITFERVVNGTVEEGEPGEVFGSVISPFTFERVVVGRVSAKSAVALPLSFNRVVQAKVTAKSRVDLPLTFSELVQAKATAKGQVVRPIVFGYVVDGSISGAKFGAVVSPFTFGRVVQAKVTARGAVVSPFSFNRVVNGTRTRFGSVVTPITFERVVAGKDVKLGRVVLPLSLTEQVVGKVGARGRVDLPLSVAYTTTGAAVRFGSVSLPLLWEVFSTGEINLVVLLEPYGHGSIGQAGRGYVYQPERGQLAGIIAGHIDDGEIEEV